MDTADDECGWQYENLRVLGGDIMTTYELMDVLGKAFADGEVDALTPHIAKNCVYSSEYANKRFESADEIIERMKYVYSNVDESSKYTYFEYL